MFRSVQRQGLWGEERRSGQVSEDTGGSQAHLDQTSVLTARPRSLTKSIKMTQRTSGRWLDPG